MPWNWISVFKKGDIIYIEGRALSYRNTLQISIVTIKPCAPENIEPVGLSAGQQDGYADDVSGSSSLTSTPFHLNR